MSVATLLILRLSKDLFNSPWSMVHTREGCGFVVSCKINTVLLIICSLIFAFSSTLISPTKAEDTAAITQYGLEVKQSQTHDSSAFTQGFLFHEGKIYESTGLYNQSSLREVTLEGEVLRQVNLSGDEFGEGLALHNGSLVQLTWKSEIAHIYDLQTFTETGNFTYGGEGWGLCSNNSNFVMSDGSSNLTIRNLDNFSIVDTVAVTYNGSPLEELNELECVGNYVFANVWHWEWIFIINLSSGEVIGTIDAAAIFPESLTSGVLNGIAYDSESETFWLTGKRWPLMHQVTWLPVTNGENDSDSGPPEEVTNGLEDREEVFESILVVLISLLFASATFILWGNGFASLTRGRGVDNPPAATISQGDGE